MIFWSLHRYLARVTGTTLVLEQATLNTGMSEKLPQNHGETVRVTALSDGDAICDRVTPPLSPIYTEEVGVLVANCQVNVSASYRLLGSVCILPHFLLGELM